MRHRVNNGITLIEAVVSMGVFALIVLSAVSMTDFASKAMTRISLRNELLESARIALDVMSAHIKLADRVVIQTEADGQAVRSVTVSFPSGNMHEVRQFDYNSMLSPDDIKYQRLEFGGNELASYISAVRARLDGHTLTLTLITSDRLRPGDEVFTEPIKLTTKLRLFSPVEIHSR